MKRIAVKCASDCLFQKIKLAVRDIAKCERISSAEAARGFDLCIAEADGAEMFGVRIVTMSREDGCDLKIPFAIRELRQAVEKCSDGGEAIILNLDNKTASFKGELIRLTELEFSLLSLLLSERGRSFSKAEILKSLWGEGVDAGVVNVYVHYLREKLEKKGDRVIISSRGTGYRIDERYFAGGENADVN